MEAGVLLKVVGYGAIPLAMGLGGIYLAVDSVRSRLKRGMLGLFFAVLTVVGVAVVYFVENNAARDHRMELEDGKKASQLLQSQLTATQILSAKDISGLRAHLDDAISKSQPDTEKLAKLCAEEGSALIRREIASQTAPKESNSELKAKALALVAELRSFGKEYDRLIGAIPKTLSADGSWTADSSITANQQYLVTEGGQRIVTEGGVPLIVGGQKETAALLQLAETERDGFRIKYLGTAVALRDQLIARLSSGVQLGEFPPSRLIAFDGYLQGPKSISDAADYLEALANKLSSGEAK